MLGLLCHMNEKDKQQVCNDISISEWECFDCKNNHSWGFPSAHSFGSKITRLAYFRFRTLTMQMHCWIVDLNYLTL